jgi:RimJ/RimL family protein N-acetyltransferase
VVATPYPIRTARLELRPLQPDDLDDVHAYQSRADVAEYLYWYPRDRDEVREVLAAKSGEGSLRKPGDRMVLAALEGASGRVVGEVNLAWQADEHRQGEIGFVFNPEFQGRGLATEAARAVLAIAFDEVQLHRVYGICDALNTASARLMERLGMRREAHLRENEIFKGRWGDEYIYAMLRREWLAGSSAPAAPAAPAAE